MKRLRAALLVLTLVSSSASAASFYFGVRLDAPVVFEQVGQTTITNVVPMVGLHAGVDFDSPSSGLGVRFALSSQIVSGVRGAIDWYYRFGLRDVSEFRPYLGLGSSLFGQPQVALLVDVHGLAGIEYQVSPTTAIFAEVSPGAAFGFSGHSCSFGPPVSNTDAINCGSLIPFTLDAAVGLNFRF
jgi:hypothetical protein